MKKDCHTQIEAIKQNAFLKYLMDEDILIK